MNSKVTKKNSSVFHDLGFDEAEAENLRIRAAAMNTLIAHLEQRTLTQAQAAKLLNVTQPRISDLMRGKLHLFSIDTLVNMLAAAGLRVELRVRRTAFSPSRPRVASAAAYASRR
jgi:predicted XRE-type DNA-binding protein